MTRKNSFWRILLVLAMCGCALAFATDYSHSMDGAENVNKVPPACISSDAANHVPMESSNAVFHLEAVSMEFTDTNPQPYSFPIKVSGGQILTVELDTAQPAEETYFAVDKIRVYDGQTLIQEIDAASLLPEGEYAWEEPDGRGYAWDGLFVNQGHAEGEPDVRDLNFDGAEDFGLLTVGAYSKNLPYSYFLWNGDKGQFDYGFTVIGNQLLEVDAKNERLIEHLHDTTDEYFYFYDYATDGTLRRRDEKRQSKKYT